MQTRQLLLPLLVALLPMAAGAHAHLTSSSPAANAVIAAAPASIELNYSESARLTALTIQKQGESPRKLAPLPTQSAKHLSVAVPSLAPGVYVVSWRVQSDDNHLASGTISFTLK
jgi:methionine-rich copper-binding protein CopC